MLKLYDFRNNSFQIIDSVNDHVVELNYDETYKLLKESPIEGLYFKIGTEQIVRDSFGIANTMIDELDEAIVDAVFCYTLMTNTMNKVDLIYVEEENYLYYKMMFEGWKSTNYHFEITDYKSWLYSEEQDLFIFRQSGDYKPFLIRLHKVMENLVQCSLLFTGKRLFINGNKLLSTVYTYLVRYINDLVTCNIVLY